LNNFNEITINYEKLKDQINKMIIIFNNKKISLKLNNHSGDNAFVI
jgi:hypothetical protein